MALVRWTPGYPARNLVHLEDDVTRFINSFFRGAPLQSNGFAPEVDIEETSDAFVVRADLPGLTQKDVTVSLIGDTLTIRGERKHEKSEKSGTALRIERNLGSFGRSFTLGAAVRGDAVKATYRDGVLEIRVPKAEEAKPREIEIQAG